MQRKQGLRGMWRSRRTSVRITETGICEGEDNKEREKSAGKEGGRAYNERRGSAHEEKERKREGGNKDILTVAV